MVFQWYLFVLLVAVAFFAKATGQTHTIEVHGRIETRYNWLPVLMITIPLIVVAALRKSGFGDTAAYIIWFRNAPATFSGIPEVLAKEGKDKGFDVFTILLKIIIGDHYQIYFGIIAAICLLCVAFVYRKYSCNFAMSMFLFLASSDYIQWTHNGMRQFIAASVILASTDLLLNKKFLQYYAVVLVMSMIHASALVMIPVSLFVLGGPWNKRTVLFTMVTLIAINFSGPLRDLIVDFMTETQYSSEVNQFLETEGTNVYRVLVFCVPPALALVFRRYLLSAKSPVLNLATNMSIISMGIYIVSAATSGIFIGRLPIYFSLYNYIILPWLVENVFDRNSKRLVYACLIVSYLAFYWYQMTVAWDFSALV